jgi:hypothetical protein
MKQRWLIVVGLLAVFQVDLAVAASRSPSLLQRILSAFTPRPVRHVYVSANDHAGAQKLESPRVKLVRAAQPLDTPIEAPTPVGATRFAESAPAGELVPPVQAAPAGKKAKRGSDMQVAQPKKAAQPLLAVPPREVAQTIQKPQPPLAKPPIETVETNPAAQPEPASRPLQTAQMFKAANKVRSVKTTQSLPAQPVQPAQPKQPMQVAILGAPNLKAALPDESAAPVAGVQIRLQWRPAHRVRLLLGGPPHRERPGVQSTRHDRGASHAAIRHPSRRDQSPHRKNRERAHQRPWAVRARCQPRSEPGGRPGHRPARHRIGLHPVAARHRARAVWCVGSRSNAFDFAHNPARRVSSFGNHGAVTVH